MISWLKDFADGATTKLAQFNNATFKNAAMAMCALMAAADGSIEASEKKKIVGFIGQSEMLKVFNASELGKLFEENCTKAVDEFARLDLIKTVSKLKGKDIESDMAMKVAVIIAKADGNFAEKEKVVVGELCGALGLNPSTYI